MAPDLIDDRDEPQDSSPESLLQFLSEHKHSSERRGEGSHPLGKRRTVAVLLAIVAAALIVVGFVIWGNFPSRGSASHAPTARTESARHHSHPHTTPDVGGSSTLQDTLAPPAKPIHVTLTAARSDSWVQVRKGSFSGRVLFDGVVSEGQSIHVVGRRFWARFGALGNFDLTINGRPVHPAFSGTVDTVITAAAIRRVPAQTQSG